MPEYLAPGVFIEEVSFRGKSIEGVGTTTAGFIGPTRFGPTDGEPHLLTSFADFERIYGGIDPLEFSDGPMPNYLAHAVQGFYEEGGNKLYVSRVFQGEGRGHSSLENADSPPTTIELTARYPGRAGNFRVEMELKVGENILDTELIDPVDESSGGRPVLRGATNFATIVGFGQDSPALPELFSVRREIDANGILVYRLLSSADIEENLANLAAAHLLTVSVKVIPTGRFEQEQVWDDLTFDPLHRNSISRFFTTQPSNRTVALPLVVTLDGQPNGAAIAEIILSQPNLRDGSPVFDSLFNNQVGNDARSFARRLSEGTDGERPRATSYRGDEETFVVDGESLILKSGLMAFEDVEEISSVAAPGSTFGMTNSFASDGMAITRLLISHCEKMRYRVAILDSADGHTLTGVRAYRAGIDSTRAALYYPWIRVIDPISGEEIDVPPSGLMAGIFARNDIQYGVHKSPANEVVRSAVRFEAPINTAQQESLNPNGVNCLRFFENRGFRVWGARTVSSDPEWKYLNVRRYFNFLERSIDIGTQWAVFENNGPELWANVRSTIEDFLYNEFLNNHLLGNKPAEAFFVRCDRSTMSQNDLDNGRLVCLIGVSPLRPAEFVIFRIGQTTANARS